MPGGHRFSFEKRHKLDSPDRGRFQPVDPLIDLMVGYRAATVLDLGAGTGYFAIPLARKLESAKVYALDVEARMLEELAKRADQAGLLGRIETLTAEATSIPLNDGQAELALMANLYHELEDRPAALREVRRVLSSPGRLIIVDWDPRAPGEAGPPKDHRIPAETVSRELALAGFADFETHDLYPDFYSCSASSR